MSRIEQLADWAAENRAQKPSLGGELKAMGREMAKDINSTLHQVFFDQPASPGEAGTPMVPTQSQVNDQVEPPKEQGFEPEM